MKTTSLLVLFLSLSSVAGHTVLTNLIVNGVVQTSCVRPRASSRYDYPISDITNPNGLQSAEMVCGWPGRTATSASKCSVPAGSTVGFQWHYEAKQDDTFIIDPSHKGPCLVYMARSETGAGPVWFKVYENGYDATSRQFCVDKLRANRGVFEAKIPVDLAPGNYLVRVELIALHEGFELGGAQPYVNCAEITITGSGTSIPSTNLVSFPGAYKATDAGLYFDIYDSFRSYPIPGPALYVAGAVTPTPVTPTPVTPVSPPATPTAPLTTSVRKSTSTSSSTSSTSTSGRVTPPPPVPTPVTPVTPPTTPTNPTSTSTGKSTSTSTTGKISPPAPVPIPAPVGTSTGAKTGVCQNDGYMTCSSTSSYQTCTHGSWSASRPCQSGTRCSPSGNYIYCI